MTTISRYPPDGTKLQGIRLDFLGFWDCDFGEFAMRRDIAVSM